MEPVLRHNLAALWRMSIFPNKIFSNAVTIFDTVDFLHLRLELYAGFGIRGCATVLGFRD